MFWQDSSHNICMIKGVIWKIIPKLSLLIWSTDIPILNTGTKLHDQRKS